ncbi:MAG: LysM domain-containing protein [Chloroflexota bacterium]
MHVIAAGQTLGDVAIAYGLTIDEINELNGLEPGALLQIGQEVVIGREPQPEATSARSNYPAHPPHHHQQQRSSLPVRQLLPARLLPVSGADSI